MIPCYLTCLRSFETVIWMLPLARDRSDSVTPGEEKVNARFERRVSSRETPRDLGGGPRSSNNASDFLIKIVGRYVDLNIP